MTAKISDLGVAKILNLTPLQVSRMTQTPGTPAYMPPEVMIADPKYDTSVDEFSYGILMIHIFSGRWPEPQVGPSRVEAGKLIPVTEAERRIKFLLAIGSKHPLMTLIMRCISNDPQLRPHASEIVEQLSEMKLEFPTSFTNQLEMLRQIKHDEEEIRALREKGERREELIQQKEEELCNLIETQAEEQQKVAEEINQLEIAYSSKEKQLQLQTMDLITENQLLKAENEARAKELKAKVTLYETQIEKYQQIRGQCEAHLAEERETCRRLMIEKSGMQSEVLKLKGNVSSLENTNSILEDYITVKEITIERNKSEIKAKTRALTEKDVTILEMSEQLTRARECLAAKQQVR